MHMLYHLVSVRTQGRQRQDTACTPNCPFRAVVCAELLSRDSRQMGLPLRPSSPLMSSRVVLRSQMHPSYSQAGMAVATSPVAVCRYQQLSMLFPASCRQRCSSIGAWGQAAGGVRGGGQAAAHARRARCAAGDQARYILMTLVFKCKCSIGKHARRIALQTTQRRGGSFAC
jgi:hypothetical protein